jgi:hypothetical protein
MRRAEFNPLNVRQADEKRRTASRVGKIGFSNPVGV